jgi:hypothetical protein
LIASSIYLRREITVLVLLTLLVTLLNAIKPLHMDDGAYYANAVQLAHHPLDPYGFYAFWSQWPEPANWAVCPPVLPYWWAIGIKLFGDSPLMWKLWLGPWVGLFVFCLHRLLRRFAGGVEMPLTWMTALSPAFLPAVNLMLDVPAMGMGLGAILLGMRAVDRRSPAMAVIAGITSAVAMQTKYTAAIAPAVILIWAILHRRLGLGMLTGMVAGGLFAAWEVFIADRYGVSHFLFNLRWTDPIKGAQTRSELLVSGLTLIGGLAPVVGLLGLAALKLPRFVTAVFAAAVVGSFASLFFWQAASGVFLALGICVWLIVLVAVFQLVRGRGCDDLFLLLWLMLEIIAYLSISPFSASRRAMGLVIILTLITGRLAAQRRPRELRWIVAGGMLLGAGFYTVDLADAMAQKNALLRAASVVVQQPGETVWFTGHWGFQFYAERAGYQPVVPDHSILRRGDWLIYPHAGINGERVSIPLAMVEEVADIRIDDSVPLAVVPFYYGSGVPMQHRVLPRVWLSVYRVERDFIPLTSYSPQFLAQWAVGRGRPLPPASIAAVLRAIPEVDPVTAAEAMKAIRASEQSGPISQ